jgi:hypothetical protein
MTDAGLTFFRHYRIFLRFFIIIARITPSAAFYGRAGFIHSATSSVDVQGATASSMYVQGVSISTASSMDMQGVTLPKVGLSGIRSVRSRNDKNVDAGTIPVPEKGGLALYQTEIPDADAELC